MVKTSIALSFLFLSFIVVAQPKAATLISYELGVSFDKMKFSSSDSRIKMNSRTGFHGLTIIKEVKQSVFVELGIYDKFISVDFTSYNPDTSNLGFAANTLQFPLRFVFRNKLFSDRLHMYSSAGISYYLTHGFKGIVYSDGNDSLRIDGNPLAKHFSTFDFGCAVNYLTSRRFSLGLSYRHTFSLKKLADYNIVANRTSGLKTDYQITYSGVSNSFFVKLQYRLNSLQD